MAVGVVLCEGGGGTLGACVTLCDSVPVAVKRGEPEGKWEGEREGERDPLTEGLREPAAVAVKVALTLADREREGEVVGVMVEELRVGHTALAVPPSDVLRDRVGDQLRLGVADWVLHAQGLGQGEGEALPVAHRVAEPQPLPVALPVAHRVAEPQPLPVALTRAVGEGEAVAEALSVPEGVGDSEAVALGEAVSVEQGEGEAVKEALGERE